MKLGMTLAVGGPAPSAPHLLDLLRQLARRGQHQGLALDQRVVQVLEHA